MKRIPERFELDEDDIRDAIVYWLNNEEIGDEEDYDFDIKFKIERKQGTPPPEAPVGGMSDWTVEVISAVATKE